MGIFSEIWKPFRKPLGFPVIYANVNKVYYESQGQLTMSDQMVSLTILKDGFVRNY